MTDRSLTKHEHVECPGCSSPTRCAREGCFIKTQAHPTSNEQAPNPDGIGKVVVGPGWYLPWHAINDLQRQSVDRLIKRAKAAHYTNVRVRINGSWEESEADWIKHMVRSSPDETSCELERLRELQEKALALDDAVAEFGIDKPQYIAEAYQAFHDVLHDGHGSPSVVKTLVEVRAFGTSIDPPSQKALAPRYELPLEWQAREWTEIDSPSSLCGLLGCNRQTPHHHKAAL